MAEAVFNVLQFGRQTLVGTAVPTTTLFPGKADPPELDRGYQNPDEDYGRLSDENPGRGSFGARGASTRIATEVRLEDFMHLLEIHAAGGIVPTGGPVYSWAYVNDETGQTITPYTIELGSVDAVQNQWRLTGCVCDELTFGFAQLAAPGASPWTAQASILALNREPSALTTVAGTPPTAVPAPATLETAYGHFSHLYEGSTATAFGSLSELAAHLIMFSATSRVPLVRRPFGGTTDVASAYGYTGKAGLTFSGEVKISASSKSSTIDVFEAAASAVQERRWRIAVVGSGSKLINTDMRVRFRSVNQGNRDGETTYLVSGSGVYDPTLGGRLAIADQNGVSVLP